jgi:protoporphyrinogen oxidase
MFGYVEGGYARVLERFGAELKSRGVRFLCGRPALGVRDTGRGADVELSTGEVLNFDYVILTVSCPRVLSLCPQLSAEERARLGKVVYQGIVCASLLLRRPLAGYYITNLTEPGLPFTAVIEMTALVDRANFGGLALAYLPRYLAQDDKFWSAPVEEIRERFLSGLERMYPDFRRTDVLEFQVSKVRDMLAITTLDYSERARPETVTSLPRVFLANSAQIANGTLNVNETVALANEAAALIQLRLADTGIQEDSAGAARPHRGAGTAA